ncbi:MULTISPECIES: fimbrial protein [Escherichia]|uniref:fimbrial protein n=1 Tax=Escherichia TaxID=561 RepID=UPI000DD7D0F9|nr:MULTISPECIES: fimbrial protein [Escherichia]EFD0656771.1 type 1 fimbrial protein [Escherichia coli]EFU8318332.1 type 1 fimbrial protein [Escherichia coli]EHC4233121.1 type 1 fimbrial protein [Escherichia coli]EIP0523454.1 type 1 fimbrial protein [Escherichia coli]EIV6481181.1 type 1 fimbrial protein [Escherichia coli]
MNKKLLPIAALIISASAMNAYAVNGTVNFTGEIIKSTCTVTSGDQKKDVFIGKYPTSAFATKGDVTASKAFTINLEKCEAGDYSLRFDGPSVAGNPNLLSVDQAGGVGIEILTNDEKVIPINQDADASSPWVNVATTGDASGTATFNLKARYKSFLDKVTAGSANASATFTIEYK